MATTLDAKGNEIINGFSTNMTPNQAITTGILNTPQIPINITPVNYPDFTTTPNSVAGDISSGLDIQKQQKDFMDKQALADNAVTSQLGLSNELARLQSTHVKNTGSNYGETGVNNLYNQVSDINAQAQALNLSSQAIPIQNQINAQGTAGTQSGVESINRDQLAQNALKALSLGQQYAIASGNYEKAKNYADQLTDAKYAQEEAIIKAKQTMLQANQDYFVTPAQKKAAEAQTELNAQKLRDIADKKAQEKDLQSLSLSIAKNGAPAKVQEAIRNAKDFNDAVIVATPYMQSAMDKADLSYKLAQTAKVYADMRNDAQTVGSNVAPENMLPFSQEYASTGKIPVGAPKGSASAIMRYAKELPQPTGALVSSITGVNPSNIGTVEQKDLSALYNITKNVAELKKLDDARVGGVVSGTLGKVFGSDAQSAYLAKRKAIVDDISRMQSGAALTADEVAFYEDYLPGRFSETAGLGQDSKKKIENFEKIMNDKLKNRLSNNNLSIYGYSTVTAPNGQEYKVGDLIQANGVTGRVNPDGSVTVVQ